MKKLLLNLIVVASLFTAVIPAVYAQTSTQTVSKEDEQMAAIMTIHTVRLVHSITHGFSDMKGNLLAKNEDGSSTYAVKGLSGMQAAKQEIIVSPDGKARYIASYKGDVKKLSFAFAAFTIGVVTSSANSDGNFSIEQNAEARSETTLV